MWRRRKKKKREEEGEEPRRRVEEARGSGKRELVVKGNGWLLRKEMTIKQAQVGAT